MYSVHCRKLCKIFRQGDLAVHALSDVDLDIDADFDVDLDADFDVDFADLSAFQVFFGQ